MEAIKTKTLNGVIVQENGIIRNYEGYLIGRLIDEISFAAEYVKSAPESQAIKTMEAVEQAEAVFPKWTYRELWSRYFKVENIKSTEEGNMIFLSEAIAAIEKALSDCRLAFAKLTKERNEAIESDTHREMENFSLKRDRERLVKENEKLDKHNEFLGELNKEAFNKNRKGADIIAEQFNELSALKQEKEKLEDFIADQ